MSNNDFAASSPSARAGYVPTEVLAEIKSMKKWAKQVRNIARAEAAVGTVCLINSVLLSAIVSPIAGIIPAVIFGKAAYKSYEHFSEAKQADQKVAHQVKLAAAVAKLKTRRLKTTPKNV